MKDDRKELKMYSDYKSPYAWLAFDSAYALEQKYNVRVRWIPFQLRAKGKGQRSKYSEHKVKYSYLDARRCANAMGGRMIRGPLKIYDTIPALIGGLYADRNGKLREYSSIVYERFFKRELEIDQADAISSVLAEIGLNQAAFSTYLAGEGVADLDRAQVEAESDGIFGVPIFIFESEPFWGNDRFPMLEIRLQEAGLRTDAREQKAVD